MTELLFHFCGKCLRMHAPLGYTPIAVAFMPVGYLSANKETVQVLPFHNIHNESLIVFISMQYGEAMMEGSSLMYCKLNNEGMKRKTHTYARVLSRCRAFLHSPKRQCTEKACKHMNMQKAFSVHCYSCSSFYFVYKGLSDCLALCHYQVRFMIVYSIPDCYTFSVLLEYTTMKTFPINLQKFSIIPFDACHPCLFFIHLICLCWFSNLWCKIQELYIYPLFSSFRFPPIYMQYV